MTLPSKELLSVVLGIKVLDVRKSIKSNQLAFDILTPTQHRHKSINIYELMHMNLKQWAKLNNVLDRIDWSGEPDDIFTKANELYDELN